MPLLESIRERWPFGLPQSVALGIAMLTLVTLSWKLWTWQEAGQGPAVPSPAESAEALGADKTLPALLSSNLFGNAAATRNGAGSMALRQSNLGLVLRAAFAATGDTRGGAIIESSNGEAHWYGLSDNLPGGATLQEVHPNHVVLNRNGSLEQLVFPPLESLVDTAAAGNSAYAGAVNPDGVVIPDSSQATPIPANLPAEDKARLIRQRLEELRNRSRT